MSRNASTARKTFMTALAWTVAIAISFPILRTFLTSFKSEAEAIASPPRSCSSTERSRIMPRCRPGRTTYGTS
jgi:ABC-type glycerol-3-phosphate transport system permease component